MMQPMIYDLSASTKIQYSFKMFQRVDNVFTVISVHFFTKETLYMMENNLTLEDMGDFEQAQEGLETSNQDGVDFDDFW